MTQDFYATVQQQQNADVASHLNTNISILKDAILRAARNGEKRIVLNNMLAHCSSARERALLFEAVRSITEDDENFTFSENYVGEAGAYKNASHDLYVFNITWR